MLKSEAVKVFGASTILARALGVTPVTVCRWPKKLNQSRSAQVIQAIIKTRGEAVAKAYFPTYFQKDV
jgi:hypothetical protein